jgi:hypothetical protein
MPSTTSGIVYPASTDDVDVPGDMQIMAASVQALFDALAAPWQDFAPGLSANSFVVTMGAGGVSQGRYKQIGQTVFWSARWVFATGASIPAGDLQFALPVANRVGTAGDLQDTLGSWTARDQSPLGHYSGSVGSFDGLNQATLSGAWLDTLTQPSFKRMTGLVPFTFAPTDVITAGGTYEAA